MCCEVKTLHRSMQYPTQRMHDAAFEGCLMLPSGAPTPVAPLFLHFAHSGAESQNMLPTHIVCKQPFIILLLPPFCLSERDCVALKHLQSSRDDLYAGGCLQHSHVNGAVTPPSCLCLRMKSASHFAAKVLRIGRNMEGKRPMAGSRRQHFSS